MRTEATETAASTTEEQGADSTTEEQEAEGDETAGSVRAYFRCGSAHWQRFRGEASVESDQAHVALSPQCVQVHGAQRRSPLGQHCFIMFSSRSVFAFRL